MPIVSSTPAGLVGFPVEFRFAPEPPVRRLAGEWWHIGIRDDSRQAGPAAFDEALRITFAKAGVFDLEVHNTLGQVLATLRYPVCATLDDELERVASWDTPQTQLGWMQTIRARGNPTLAELERLIKKGFLADSAQADRWARGVRLLVCLHYPELLHCRHPRTSPEEWEDALERVVLTFLVRRDYNPAFPFKPFFATLLHHECVNGYRHSGYPNPDKPEQRKAFLDLEPLLVADPHAEPIKRMGEEIDLDERPLLIRIPAKLRDGIRLNDAELNFAARRNLEFAWEPRRRKPWTLRALQARALRAGTSWNRAINQQRQNIRACEERFRLRDNTLPDPYRDQEDPAWEKVQRQHHDAQRANGQAGRVTLSILNEDALREAIPWYSGPGHSRATTLFEMRELADRIMALVDGPLGQTRGQRLQGLGDRLRQVLGELIDGYGREAQQGALERYGLFIDTIEELVALVEPGSSPDRRQALDEFQKACAFFSDKLRALDRLYPCRRLLHGYLNAPKAGWLALAGLSAWLDQGTWRNHLSPEDRDILRAFADLILARQSVWPKDDAPGLRLLTDWLQGAADEDGASLAWLRDLDGCWRWGLEVSNDLPRARDLCAPLVETVGKWRTQRTPGNLKTILERSSALEEVCRKEAEKLRIQGRALSRVVEQLGLRLKRFRERIAES